ncbi:WD40 repeat domain-containing protein [Nocardiopsis sp. NPDC055824]
MIGRLCLLSGCLTKSVPWFAVPKRVGVHRDRALSVTWSEGSQLVASGSADGTLRLWDADMPPEELTRVARRRTFRTLMPQESRAYLLALGEEGAAGVGSPEWPRGPRGDQVAVGVQDEDHRRALRDSQYRPRPAGTVCKPRPDSPGGRPRPSAFLVPGGLDTDDGFTSTANGCKLVFSGRFARGVFHAAPGKGRSGGHVIAGPAHGGRVTA